MTLLRIVTALCISHIALGQPVANFSASVTAGCVPLVVQFSDLSTGNPTSWNWDFGNGQTSTLKNPVVTYATPGSFTVKLTVNNIGGSNTQVKNQYITVSDIPVAKFTVNDSADCVPFTTGFTDLSSTNTGNIASWEWDFDDGGTSALQHPQHLYTQPGDYNITLKVTNSGGCFNSISKLAYIKAADSIRTLFTFSSPSKCKPPETIRFTNSTLGPGTMSYRWDFGDGATSTQTSVSHTYTNGGLYTITLYVSNSIGCKDTLVYKDTLAIKNIRAVINSADSVCVNTPVPFVNATSPAPLTSKWTFGDGSSSFGATTAKSWLSPGVYTVKLVSNFSNCSDSVTKNISVLKPPTVNFAVSENGTCKPPLTVNFIDLSGAADSWNWDFGDGSTSGIQNPVHTFTTSDTFNIKLTVGNTAGCTNTINKHGFVKISKPLVSFYNLEEGGCIPYTYRPVPVVSAVDSITGYRWDFGNGNVSTDRYPAEVYTDSGTYTVKLFVTTSGGCFDSAVMNNAVRTGLPPVVNFGALSFITCPGNNIQFIDSSAPADRWQWSFNDGKGSTQQNPLHRFSDTGKFSVKLVAWNNGCADSITKPKIITVLPGLARFRPVFNCTNKKEVYFKDSSVLPQSWFWDFGDGYTSTTRNPTHQFGAYQTYSVSLTTTNDSCTYTQTIDVDVLNEVPDFITLDSALCKGDSTFFLFRNFNKKNVLKYYWNFGDGTIDSTSNDSVWHRYPLAGSYNVSLTIKDVHDCFETTTKNAFIHVFAPSAGFTIGASGGCLNKAVSFTDTSNRQSGDRNIARWEWDFGDGTSQVYPAPLPNPVTHTYSGTGYYFPSLKIQDSAGCADSISYVAPITINQPVAGFSSPNYNTCINDTVVLRNFSTGIGLQYLWSFGDGTFATDSLPVKQYAANGLYTMKLLVTDVFGCKDSLRKNNYINVKTVTAAFSVSDSVGICTPFKVNFTNNSSNSLSQVWDFGDGGFSSTANPVYYYNTTGTYYAKLKAIRSPGCFSTDSVKIKVSAPSATLDYQPLSGCAPLDVAFNVSASDNVSFIWDFNDGTSYSSTDSAVTHTFLLPGNFIPSVILKDSLGCIIPVVGIDTVKIVSSHVVFGTPDSLLCENGTTQFTDSSFSGSAVNSYSWSFGDGGLSTQQNPQHYFSLPGAYSVKLVLTTAGGCRDSVTKVNYIKVYTMPQVMITGVNSDYCGTAQITPQATWLNADTTFLLWQWDLGNGNIWLTQSPPVQQYPDTGQYNIALRVSNAGGCVDTINAITHVRPIPLTNAGNDTVICKGSSALLQATGADTYSWQPAGFLSCTTCSSPVSTSVTDITYYVQGTTVYGCQQADSVFIKVQQPFLVSGLQASDSLCAGNSIRLNVTGAENYSWTPANGLSDTVISGPVASPDSTTRYTVTGYDNYNCFRDSASIVIKVKPVPVVDAGPDLVMNAGQVITLSPLYSGDVTGWYWSPATNLSCTSCPNPNASPGGSVTYTIGVTNNEGCTASDELAVQVNCDKTSIYLPSAFTPGSSNNNLFYPLNVPGAGSIKVIHFAVYNRLGQLVFEKNNFYSNDRTAGWDGRFKGRESSMGGYLYSISYRCNNRNLVSFGGNFLLIR